MSDQNIAVYVVTKKPTAQMKFIKQMRRYRPVPMGLRMIEYNVYMRRAHYL